MAAFAELRDPEEGAGFFFFSLPNIYLKTFIYLWLHWVLAAAYRLFPVVERGLLSSCRCRLLVVVASLVAELSSCDAWAQLPHGMWDFSSLTRDRTHIPCTGRQIVNHWTLREVRRSRCGDQHKFSVGPVELKGL